MGETTRRPVWLLLSKNGEGSRRLSKVLTLPVWTSRHHSEQDGHPPERVECRMT